MALGRALSAWEGVHVATQVLFEALTKDDQDFIKKSHGFEETLTVPNRIAILQNAAADYFKEENVKNVDLVATLKLELMEILTSYKGWSERRNELAHGYVTTAWSPDYTKEEQPIIRNYSLCPNHVRSARWRYGEPIYNYVASEVRSFAISF